MPSRLFAPALLAALMAGTTAFAEGTSPSTGSNAPGTMPAAPATATPTSPPSTYGSGGASSASGPAPARPMDMTPMVLVVPTYFATDPNVGNGCWARLFDNRDFGGVVFAMVGPVDIPDNRAGFITGFEAGRNYDSVMVGPNATLVVWDKDNFQNRSTTFSPGEAVPNLNTRMGSMEDIKSMRLSCNR